MVMIKGRQERERERERERKREHLAIIYKDTNDRKRL